MNHKSSIMKNSGLVIFDIDGTLTESHTTDGDLFFDTLCTSLKLRNVNRDLSSYSEVTDSGIVHEIFMKEFGRVPAEGELNSLEKTYATQLNAALGDSIHFSEKAGASAFVEKLELMGFNLGIATGNWREPARIKLRALGLERLMLQAATSTEARARRDILQLAALGTANFELSTKWYIGDGPWDMECAKALEFKFIGVGDRTKRFNPLHWVGDFRSMDDLVQILS